MEFELRGRQQEHGRETMNKIQRKRGKGMQGVNEEDNK
jgi:hypothetical protein